MKEYGGRAVDSSQDTCSGRKIWTEHVVVIFSSRSRFSTVVGGVA